MVFSTLKFARREVGIQNRERRMMNMTKVGKTYLCLGIAQALHSMEEMHNHLFDFFWTATGLFKHYIPNLPKFKMSAELFAILNMGFIVVILATVPFVELNRRWAIVFAWCWAIIEVLNGLLHMIGVVIFSESNVNPAESRQRSRVFMLPIESSTEVRPPSK